MQLDKVLDVERKLSGLGYQEEMPTRRPEWKHVKIGAYSVAVVTVRSDGTYSIQRNMRPVRKLTMQEILDLQPNDPHEYWVRLMRLTYPKPTEVWQGRSLLHVQRTVPGHKKHPNQLAVLAVKAYGWAEYGKRDVCDDGQLIAEDYALDIWW